jgi:hypothetical protein
MLQSLTIPSPDDFKLVFQITDEMLKIADFPPRCCAVLWDCQPQERDVFIAFDDTKITTYLYSKDSIQGLPVH